MVDLEMIDFSNFEVVRVLIVNRSALESISDRSNFLHDSNMSELISYEDIMCIYVSLDEIIHNCNFNSKRSILLNLLFKGHPISEICNMGIGYNRMNSTGELLKRMIKDINKEALKSG